jgi:hypothetical protein
MPIAAVPAGVEIKKITPTQKKALDELLKKQKDADLQTELLTTIIPTAAFVGVSVAAGVGIWAYLNQESITNSVKGFAEGSGKLVADALLNVLPSPDTPLTPEVTAQGTELDICTRFEADYVAQNDLKNSIPIVGGTLQALGQLDTIKKMKKNGCSKPFVIPQSQWDQG